MSMSYDGLFDEVLPKDTGTPDMSWLRPEKESGPTAPLQKDDAPGEIDERAAERGGGSDPQTAAPAETPVEDALVGDLDEAVSEDALPEVAADTAVSLEVEAEETPVSLQKTDHQEAVQQAAGRGGGNDTPSDDVLPLVGFGVPGVGRDALPRVRKMPEQIIGSLRDILRSAAVRELGVSDRVAREFASRISQTSIVVAFLAATIDVRIEADATTMRAAELFRSRDPQLGALLNQTKVLEQLAREQIALAVGSKETLAQSKRTGENIEHGLAWMFADRVSNLGRDVASVDDVNVRDQRAIRMRDRIRDETAQQRRSERDREGRPIR